MDGQIYSAVSQDLATGKAGGLWQLQMSETFFKQYHDQVPVFMWVQAIFIWLFGNSHLSESIMSVCIVIANVLMMRKLWKSLMPGEIGEHLSWMPVLFWASIPLAMWVLANNMIEMLMGCFALAAVTVITLSLPKEKFKVLPLLIGGGFIWLATFSKGFQGAFPVVTIILYLMVWPSRITKTRALLGTLIIVSVPVIITAVLWMFDGPREYLQIWFSDRIAHSFSTDSTRAIQPHWFLAWRLFRDIVPALILIIIPMVIVALRKKWKAVDSSHKAHYYFILIGLSGMLPLMLTTEQRSFYLGTSLPFFGIGFACWAAPYFYTLTRNLKVSEASAKIWKVGGVVAIIGALVFSSFSIGKFSRSPEELADAKAIGEYLPNDQTYGVVIVGSREFLGHAFMARFYDISFDQEWEGYEYVYTPLTHELDSTQYELVPMELNMHRLYRKR